VFHEQVTSQDRPYSLIVKLIGFCNTGYISNAWMNYRSEFLTTKRGKMFIPIYVGHQVSRYSYVGHQVSRYSSTTCWPESFRFYLCGHLNLPCIPLHLQMKRFSTNTFLMLVQPFATASVHLKVWDSRDQTLSVGALFKVEDVLSICLKLTWWATRTLKDPIHS
jgi:hypothetical protein